MPEDAGELAPGVPGVDQPQAASELFGEYNPLPDGDVLAAALDDLDLELNDLSEEVEVIAQNDGKGGVGG